jgi:hypothetical protein
MTLKEIRNNYPQYDNKSDEELADAIHGKFYSNLPKEKVYAKLGLNNKSEIAQTPFNENKNQEKTGFSGIAEDVLGRLGSALKSGKGFVFDIPKNLEKSGEDIQKHPLGGPLHIAGQLGAEAASIGKGIVNSPHDLLKYLLKKNMAVDIPVPGTKYHTSDLIPHIPEDTGVEKALGLEANPEKGDTLIRGLTDAASLLIPGKAVAKGTAKIFKGPDLKQTIRSTQEKVNEATTEAGKIFDKVESEVGKRGVANIPIKKQLISDAQSYLAKTPANKELIKKAQSGDYQALRSLQADLRVKGEKALSSALSADHKMGEEILSIRDQVNQAIQNHLEKTGHKDLSEKLNKARSDYRDIQKTYFSTPQLAKVFGKSQKVPKNPMTLLTEESTEMKRFMSAHPEVEKMLTKALKHEKRAKAGKILLGIAGVGTSAELAHKALSGK